MATRVDKTSGLSGLPESSLIRRLRSLAGKKERNTNFIGLKRSNALSDVSDPARSLSNLLSKINTLDQAERVRYKGPFNAVDWSVTRGFIGEGINKDYLAQLAGVSVGGGSLGSTVSTTPRIRIEDRLSQVDSFYGLDGFFGLHSGPNAQFYRQLPPNHLGYIRFSFDELTEVVTVIELVGTDKVTPITPGDLTGTEVKIVVDLERYENPDSTLDLSGSGISLTLESNFTISSGTSNLVRIRALLGNTQFSASYFKLVRPVSFLNRPLWFTESPSNPVGSDDNDPATSARVLKSEGGQIVPEILEGYWFSKSYVDSRWTDGEKNSIGDILTAIVEDSNMRWENLPSPIRSEQYNWGIRWDGYLRITPGIYAFQVETNVQVKVDVNLNGWVNVVDTEVSAKETSEKYISSTTFNSSSISSTYRYFFGDGADDWVAYMPITVRLFYGGSDKADGSFIPPAVPDLFIKTTTLSATTRFYSEDFSVVLSGTDGSWSVASPELAGLIAILQDSAASVRYSLVSKDSILLDTPITIVLATDGTVVTSTTTGLVAGNYVLSVLPLRSSTFNSNLVPLWKGRIASPEPGSSTYTSLADGLYSPDIEKREFEFRPEYWKISSGHPYNRALAPSPDNTPIDGWIRNSFNPTLRSNAIGIGLYGDGSGVFSSKPNLILGEARYSTEDAKGSNYIGIRLSPNRLGEGGKLICNALPVNNSTFTAPNRLGENDLGGDPNHKTAAFDNVTSEIVRLYLWTDAVNPSPGGYQNKYYLVSNLGTVSASDDPTVYGLPAFSSLEWLSPLTVVATEIADDLTFTTGVQGFVAPLSLGVEKVTVGGFDLLAFTTTLPSLLTGGSEVSSFSTKYVRIYTQDNVTFQYGFVDSGEGVSVSDVLKLTYDGGNFSFTESEVPRPPADRVTPFGFDLPDRTNGLCYPPYLINDTLLSDIAVDDTTLYASDTGEYDVIWGDDTVPALGGKVLKITEKIEFFGADAVEALSTPVSISSSDYTHRIKFDIPLPDIYDEDVLEHIGNGEKVKESYYAYVRLDG